MLTGRCAVPVAGVIFRDVWESVNPDDPGHTWSNANPFARATLDVARRIDHILTTWPKAGGAGHCLAARIAGGEPGDVTFGSDHLAVVADLRY
jgi:exonuclease III